MNLTSGFRVITREVFGLLLWSTTTITHGQSDMYRTLWKLIAGQYFVLYKNTDVTKL